MKCLVRCYLTEDWEEIPKPVARWSANQTVLGYGYPSLGRVVLHFVTHLNTPVPVVSVSFLFTEWNSLFNKMGLKDVVSLADEGEADIFSQVSFFSARFIVLTHPAGKRKALLIFFLHWKLLFLMNFYLWVILVKTGCWKARVFSVYRELQKKSGGNSKRNGQLLITFLYTNLGLNHSLLFWLQIH